MLRLKPWFESFLITLLVFLLLWLLYLLINISFKPLNYITSTISSINLNDLYFSSVANQQADTSVVIINIEDLDRGGIQTLVEQVAAAGPSVIGIDIFFSHQKKTLWDAPLMETLLKNREKIVMAATCDESGWPDPQYWHLPGIRYGHAGLLTNETSTDVVREFQPMINGSRDTMWSFSAVLAAMVNPDAAKKLRARNNAAELIHFIGSEQAFRLLSYHEVSDDSVELQKILGGKIVLLGYCGGNVRNSADLNDIFFTPVGFSMEANRRPDMYGIAVHANILSMILHERYITRLPAWIVFVISFMLTLIYVRWIVWLSLRWSLAFEVTGLISQLAAFVLILWISFLLFSNLSIALSVKYILVGIVLSLQVLSFYQILVKAAFRYTGFRSIFDE